MKQIVLGALLLRAVPLFGATPLFGPEIPVTAPAVVRGDNRAFSLAIASSGSIALAVWAEDRNGQEDLFGTRIDAAGNVLDPEAIRLTATPFWDREPRIVWGGQSFVLAWDGGPAFGNTIWVETIDQNGRIVEPAAAVGKGYVEDVAVSPLGVIAVAARSDANSGLYSGSNSETVYLFEAGHSPRTINLTDRGRYARLAATEGGFAATWSSGPYNHGEIHLTRLTGDGTIIERDVTVIDLPEPLSGYAIAARRDDVFIAGRYGTQIMLLQAPIRQQARVVRSIPLAPPVNANPTNLTVFGDGFLLTVAADRAEMWRLSASGELLESQKVAATDDLQYALTLLDGRVYAVTTNSFDSPSSVYGRFVDGDEPTILNGRAFVIQSAPTVASDGEILLIIWNETRDRTTATKGVLAARDGRPVREPFEIFAGTQATSRPAAIFAAGEYVVMRVEGRASAPLYNLVATHVSRGGIPRRDRTIISDIAFITEPSLATDSVNIAVSWDSFYGQLGGYGSYLTPGGVTNNNAQFGLAYNVPVASNGAMFVFAVAGLLQILRTAADGAFLSTETISSLFASKASIASDGNGFLVTFVVTNEGSVMALPLDHDAMALGTATLIRAKGDDTPRERRPEMTWNGGTYDVAWAGPADGTHFPRTYLIRLTRDGQAASELIELPGDDTPRILGLGDGQSMMVYSRMVPELGGSRRVFVRSLASPHQHAVGR